MQRRVTPRQQPFSVRAPRGAFSVHWMKPLETDQDESDEVAA
jgi:hypothetical protein